MRPTARHVGAARHYEHVPRLLPAPPALSKLSATLAALYQVDTWPAVAHVFQEHLNRAYVFHSALDLTIGNPYVGERRPGSVGLPFPGVSVRLVDEARLPVGDGTVGEVWVRGPTVFGGYWRRPDADAEAFRRDPADTTGAAWFCTGDLAERSADGYYTLRGRRTDVIISGGFNVYPREIEELLLELPGVREAAVVGVPDERRGEMPIAYVVAEDPCDTEALLAECRRQLASFKVPRTIVRLDRLPRTPLGKVQKHLLPPVTLA